MTDGIKSAVDVAAVSAGIGSWLTLLPDAAALLSVIWLALRIWETKTVQRLLRRT
tara:strand:+ start:336 stop:500 length:165 start_codon:yes stop_codon:yes gene_type:complete